MKYITLLVISFISFTTFGQKLEDTAKADPGFYFGLTLKPMLTGATGKSQSTGEEKMDWQPLYYPRFRGAAGISLMYRFSERFLVNMDPQISIQSYQSKRTRLIDLGNGQTGTSIYYMENHFTIIGAPLWLNYRFYGNNRDIYLSAGIKPMYVVSKRVVAEDVFERELYNSNFEIRDGDEFNIAAHIGVMVTVPVSETFNMHFRPAFSHTLIPVLEKEPYNPDVEGDILFWNNEYLWSVSLGVYAYFR